MWENVHDTLLSKVKKTLKIKKKGSFQNSICDIIPITLKKMNKQTKTDYSMYRKTPK